MTSRWSIRLGERSSRLAGRKVCVYDFDHVFSDLTIVTVTHTVFTYRELMKITLNYAGLASRRLILSLPFWVGYIQGFFLEKLPESMFTVTRDQVKQLKNDNVETDPSDPNRPADRLSIADLLVRFPPANSTTSMFTRDAHFNNPRSVLKSVHDILPTYIGEGAQTTPVSGKRMHGRKGAGTDEMLAEVKRMTEQSGFNKAKQ